MNEHLHPIFRDILNNVFNAQSPKTYYQPTDDDGQWAHQQELEAQQIEEEQPQ